MIISIPEEVTLETIEEISDEWLVKVDSTNKTLEWREHELAYNIKPSEKIKHERKISAKYPDHKWLRVYKAVIDYSRTQNPKPIYSTLTVNATSEYEAQEMFNKLKIRWIKLKR